MRYILIGLVTLVIINLWYVYHATPEKTPPPTPPPKPRLRSYREDCFTWTDFHRQHTRANNAIEYLLADNDSAYCHAGAADEYFGVPHEQCSRCKRKESFWKAVRARVHAPPTGVRLGKTVCVASKHSVRMYRKCAFIKEHSLTEQDYEMCRHAAQVVYDIASEEGYLCALLSRARVVKVGEYGRYH